MKFGLDIGNSRVKGAVLEDDNTLKAVLGFPSAINRINNEKYLTYNHEGDFYLKVIDSPLRHYDDIVAVGERAMDIPDYKEYDVGSTSYKTDHPMTTSLLFGSIAQELTDETEISIKVAVSIPIIESKSIGLAKDYREKLVGDHKIEVYRDGDIHEVVVHITQAVVSNEGQAGFFGMLDTIDKPFRKALDAVYKDLGETSDPVGTFEDFLVCDIGEGTSDISVFREKRFNPDFSFSVTQGIGSVLEGAMADAKRERLTIESRKKLQEVLASDNPRQARRREQWKQYVTPKENAFIDQLVETIMNAYGNGDYFDAIIFFGGGFSALTGYRIENGKVKMDNPRLFEELNAQLKDLNKGADLVFGIPEPYSQTINQRGLTQILTSM